MSFVESPAGNSPLFLEGLTCDGFRPGPPGCGESAVSGFLLEEMDPTEKEAEAHSLPCDALTSSAGEMSARHPTSCPPGEMVKGLVWAVAVHAALLLAVVLSPMEAFHAAESPFITVSLLGPGEGFGDGTAGTGRQAEGTGGQAAASSNPSVDSTPPPDRAARLPRVREVCEPSRPEQPEPAKTVLFPPESPVIKEKRHRRSAVKPTGERPVLSSKPKEATTPDVHTPQAACPAPTPPEPGPLTDGAAGAATEGPGAGDGGIGGEGGPDTGRGGMGGRSGGMAGEFTAGQVDHPPVVLHKVDPRFPETARRLGISGKIVLKFLVKPDGHVCRPSVLEVVPSGLFEECVLSALNQWVFKPGTYRGKAVPTWVVQTIHFKLTR